MCILGGTLFKRDFAKKLMQGRPMNLEPFRMRWSRVAIIAVVGLVPLLTLLGSGEDVRASVGRSFMEEWIPARIMPATQDLEEQRVLLRAGDTTQTVLAKLGFSAAEAAGIVRSAKDVYSLRHVRAGHEWFKRSVNGKMHVFYQIDSEKLLHIQPWGDGWKTTVEPRKVSTRVVNLEGVIHDNLFVDAAHAGMDDRTTMNLVEIFSWDVDFARGLRSGDRFKVLLEESFDARGNMLDRTILAAEFVNQGRSYKAIRFKLRSGKTDYFTPDGKNLRKAYLRSPVKYSRISSRFSTRRKHPILGYTRAHRGVDYAARAGTPVRAVGDGRVVYKGWKGGYGRYVKIRHKNSNHATAYAHLSRYAKGLRRGMRVKQGQVIGYVGMSGLATGPHLHFEFRVRGRAVNPLTIKSPAAHPVPRREMARFVTMRDQLLARLEYGTRNLAWS
jgi:murein DD-endopeptidase MepM/ murein hydrolase activator NlpD